jgi:16S rRNA (cytosine967-C5)-methyltransferase
MKNDPRTKALSILSNLDSGHATLDALMERQEAAGGFGDRRDRSLLNALVYGVLRWRGRLDHILAGFSKTPLQKVDPLILNILRLGLFQIIYLDRVPASAAVNSSVNMAKKNAPAWVAGYVNALLRRSAAEHRRVAFPPPEADPILALATAGSFPYWLVKRWIKRYGVETTQRLCEALNRIPPICVRANRLKVDREALIDALRGEVEDAGPGCQAPEAVVFTRPPASIPELAAFKEGKFQVQDEAAQLVTLLLDPQPRETVLDACAGLGGKTGHAAACMQNRGRILAWDKDPKKLQKLSREMQRLGVDIVTSEARDLQQAPPAQLQGSFDRILLDAPCSGLGTIRRNPDIKWAGRKNELSRLGEAQRRLLAHLAGLLKPGGVMVYAVCSLEPEETEEPVHWFLKNRPEFAIDRDAGRLPAPVAAAVHSSSCLKTHPEFMGMDGFFAVRLVRRQ